MSKLNIKPRTIFCYDNLEVMRGMNGECIDLIYLDPPFNKNDSFTAPIGTTAEGAGFKDIWGKEDIKDEWVKDIEQNNDNLRSYLRSIKEISKSSNYCYLVYMAIRLIECRRVLKPSGTLYLHCDQTMSSHLKVVMDCIFGEDNFKNNIIWHYGKWSNKTSHFQRNHDDIICYSKDKSSCLFNPLYRPRRSTAPYHTNVVKAKNRQHQLLIYDEKNTPQSIRDEYAKKGYKEVIVKSKGVVENDVWTFLDDKRLNLLNSQSKERTGYPTQKPLALLQRIIQASTTKGQVVLDPFCGCATTCVAAENLGRQWIGIDVSHIAYDLVRHRLKRETPTDLLRGDPNFATTPPKRSHPKHAAERKWRDIHLHSVFTNQPAINPVLQNN